MPLQCACPRCFRILALDGCRSGDVVDCPACQAKIRLPDLDALRAQSEAHDAAPPAPSIPRVPTEADFEAARLAALADVSIHFGNLFAGMTEPSFSTTPASMAASGAAIGGTATGSSGSATTMFDIRPSAPLGNSQGASQPTAAAGPVSKPEPVAKAPPASKVHPSSQPVTAAAPAPVKQMAATTSSAPTASAVAERRVAIGSSPNGVKTAAPTKPGTNLKPAAARSATSPSAAAAGRLPSAGAPQGATPAARQVAPTKPAPNAGSPKAAPAKGGPPTAMPAKAASPTVAPPKTSAAKTPPSKSVVPTAAKSTLAKPPSPAAKQLPQTNQSSHAKSAPQRQTLALNGKPPLNKQPVSPAAGATAGGPSGVAVKPKPAAPTAKPGARPAAGPTAKAPAPSQPPAPRAAIARADAESLEGKTSQDAASVVGTSAIPASAIPASNVELSPFQEQFEPFPYLDDSQVVIERWVLYAQGALIAIAALGGFAAGFLFGRVVPASQSAASPAATSIEGRVVYRGEDQSSAPDAGAVIIALPSDAQPAEMIRTDGLRPQDPPPAENNSQVRTLEALNGGYVRADQAGGFRLAIAPGRYLLLAISRHEARPVGDAPKPEDVARLEPFFSSVPAFIGQAKYKIVERQFGENEPVEIDF